MNDKKYVVTFRVIGEQTSVVYATSKKEAVEKAKRGEIDIQDTQTDFEVLHHLTSTFKAKEAQE